MNTLSDAKASLIAGMDERRARAEAIVDRVDPDMRVHGDTSDWTAKDLIVHLTLFEADMVRAIQSFIDGEKFRLDFRGATDVNGFNEIRRLEHIDDDWEQVKDNWSDTRDRLRAMILAFPADEFETPFSTPFLQKFNVMQAVKGCGVHEKEHIGQISVALESQSDA